MYKRYAALLSVCFALAACSDSPANREMTGPDVRPMFDVATLSEGSAIDLATGETVVGTSDVGAEQAATGGRASGRADITASDFPLPLSEQYSFNALSTGPGAPLFAAKGQFQGKLQFGASTYDLHAEVNCLRILPSPLNNRAVVSGPLKKFTIDGQPQPMNLDIIFEVEDNGEGNPTVDRASRFFVAQSGIQACRFFQLLLEPNQNGNIQVRPE